MSSVNLKIPGYEIESELGRGGMGVVYKVRQLATDRVLALKLIRISGTQVSIQELARFRIEAEAMACLNHPNIIKIRDVGVFAGHPYFALDFAERGSLAHRINHRPQPPGWSARLMATLADAMKHAHGRGMLHRDLKPANVLLMAEDSPKISDFGLVKFAAPMSKVSAECCTFLVNELDLELGRYADELRAQYGEIPVGKDEDLDEVVRSAWQQCGQRTGLLDDPTKTHVVKDFIATARQPIPFGSQVVPRLEDMTATGSVLGSPQYMSPEQATSQLKDIGPATDIYALGGILYELLTGQPPIRRGSISEMMKQVVSETPLPPRSLVSTVPKPLDDICMRCLAKKPTHRFTKADQLADALNNWLDTVEDLSDDRPPDAGFDKSAHQLTLNQSLPTTAPENQPDSEPTRALSPSSNPGGRSAEKN